MEGTVAEETVIQEPIVERFANEKMVVEETVNRNWNLINLYLNG